MYGLSIVKTRIKTIFYGHFPNTYPFEANRELDWQITELKDKKMTFHTYYQGLKVVLELEE